MSPILQRLRRRFEGRRGSPRRGDIRRDDRLQAFFDRVPVGMASLDAQGRFLAVNGALEQLLGYSEAELLGRAFEEISHPDDAEVCRPLFERMQDGLLDRFEVDKRYLRKDGRVVYAHVALGAIRDDEGRLLYTLGLAHDVSAKQEQAADLRRSKDRLEVLVRAVRGIVWECDAATFRFRYVSPQAEKILGYPVAGWYETPGAWLEHLHPDDRARVLSECAQQTQAKRDHTLEYRIFAKDGRVVWLRDLVTVVVEDGRATTLRGVMLDITEEMRAREELERLAHVALNTSDAVYAFGLDGMVERWNRGAERLYGYAEREMLGRPAMTIVPPHRMGEARDLKKRLFSGEEIPAYETQRLRKDGTLVDVHVSLAALRDSAGRVVGGLAVARDITARKAAELDRERQSLELERRVHERTAELRSANEALDGLIQSISRGFGSPLRTIDRLTRLLLESDEKRGDYVLRLRRAGRRMAELIASVLGLARASRAPLRPRTLDLGAMAAEVVEELRAQEPGRAVSVDIAPALTAEGDPVLLRLALQALLDNAWKFTRARADAKITFYAEKRNGELVFRLADNGAGFDPAYADRLFRPFERLVEREELGGHGLGLFLARRVIERHGGRIWADAAPGTGASFRFTLPRR